MTRPVEVKICGLTRLEDARAAAAAGARYGGVILAPGSPRTVDPERVPGIFGDTGLVRCGVVVNAPVHRIEELVGRLQLQVVQLHGDETPELARSIRESLGVEVWKAVRPRSGEEYERAAMEFEGAVDGLLLDGWSPSSRGGTGVRFPWREVAARRTSSRVPLKLIAAGGLNPENVGEMIDLVRPDVVDVSSGVEEAPGLKDAESIRRFVSAASAAMTEKGVA